MQLFLSSENAAARRVYNKYKVGGVNGHPVDCRKNEYDQFVFKSSDKYDFDTYYGSGEKEPGDDNIAPLFEDIMADYAVELARDGDFSSEQQVDVINNNRTGARVYLVTANDVTLLTEDWDRGEGDNIYHFDINRKVQDVREAMRDRAFDGELSEETKLYLSDEEASDLLLKEQEGEY